MHPRGSLNIFPIGLYCFIPLNMGHLMTHVIMDAIFQFLVTPARWIEYYIYIYMHIHTYTWWLNAMKLEWEHFKPPNREYEQHKKCKLLKSLNWNRHVISEGNTDEWQPLCVSVQAAPKSSTIQLLVSFVEVAQEMLYTSPIDSEQTNVLFLWLVLILLELFAYILRGRAKIIASIAFGGEIKQKTHSNPEFP